MLCVSSCSTGFMTFCGIPPARYSITHTETHRHWHMHAYAHISTAHTFIPSATHTRCSALRQAVTAVWHQPSCLIISFSERCPVPSTKTNMAGGDESINQARHLPIVMFHLRLMRIECLRKFPIMHGQHFQSASGGAVLIDESSETDRLLSKQQLYDWWSSPTLTELMHLERDTTLCQCLC